MSSNPNRFHEEGNRKRPVEESALFSNPRKLIRPLDNNIRLPSESGQDGHLSNTQRIDPLDADRRSPLLHQRTSSPSNYVDPHGTVGNRSEFKSTKDSTVKAETRETIRELYAGTRIDHKGIRIDQNARFDTRRDEKEIRSARSPHNYFTGDVKFGKDGHVAANSRSSSKESKGYPTGQRYSEPSTKGLDPCRVAGLDLVTANEVTRNFSTTEERNSFASYAAVGEDRVEIHREKDMKKEGKHEDVDQRDEDKNDHTNSLQVGGVIKDYHGPLQEETQQCERERYVTQNDKDHYDKKDCKQYVSAKTNEEALLDGSEKTTDMDIIELQQQEIDDSCRVSDKDIKDKGRETYVDVEVKHEINDTCYNKESGDRYADEDIRRNANAFGNDVQQQRTMLQSLETPQGDFQLFGAQSNTGSQGKNEVATVVYKPGSCTPELLKSWREFEASQDKKNDERYQGGPILKIQIPGEYVTATNPQVKGAQLWGKDIYTDDSDIVAVLMHIGYCCRAASPTRAIQELHATVTLLPPQDWYTSSLRNGIRSRAQRTCDGCSFRVERCCIMKVCCTYHVTVGLCYLLVLLLSMSIHLIHCH